MASKKKTPPPSPQSLGLPAGGVETHAHLDMEPLDADLDAVLERASAAGVSHVGQVFLGPDAYENGKGAFEGRDGVFFITGIHPHDAESVNGASLDALARAFRSDARIKALGEIGLDFYRDWSPFPAQHIAFREQLSLAREKDLPVVIHSRDAAEETLETLDDMGFSDRPVLWHCFGGGVDLANEIVSRGWLVSIPGTVTFPKNEAMRRAVAAMPLDALVLETDCPFLTPIPYRGKTNEPSYLAFTAAEVAHIRDIEPAVVWRAAARNAAGFFGLSLQSNS
ncbi:MAG: TatD family hydrolase [Oceanidesulfovibrio sp.]